MGWQQFEVGRWRHRLLHFRVSTVEKWQLVSIRSSSKTISLAEKKCWEEKWDTSVCIQRSPIKTGHFDGVVSKWTTVRWRFAYFNNLEKSRNSPEMIFFLKNLKKKFEILKVLIFFQINLKSIIWTSEIRTSSKTSGRILNRKWSFYNGIIFKEIVMRSKNLNFEFNFRVFLVLKISPQATAQKQLFKNWKFFFEILIFNKKTIFEERSWFSATLFFENRCSWLKFKS